MTLTPRWGSVQAARQPFLNVIILPLRNLQFGKPETRAAGFWCRYDPRTGLRGMRNQLPWLPRREAQKISPARDTCSAKRRYRLDHALLRIQTRVQVRPTSARNSDGDLNMTRDSSFCDHQTDVMLTGPMSSDLRAIDESACTYEGSTT